MAGVNDPNETRGPQFTAAMWSLVAISGLCIFLRMLARHRRGTPFWWDDGMIALAWVCLAGAAGFNQYCIFLGLGHHTQNITLKNLEGILLYGGIITTALAIATAVLSKVSFALSLLRITSSGCTEVTRKTIWGIIFSLATMLVVAVAMLMGACSPMEKYWRPGIEGKCLSPAKQLTGAQIVAAYSGVADIALAILPWKIIWCLPVSKREKLCLIIVMSLGFFAGIASFIKCAQIHLLADPDFSYVTWWLCFWSFFEPTLTIIAASMPIFRVFFRDGIRIDNPIAKGLNHSRNRDPESNNSGPQLTVVSSSGSIPSQPKTEKPVEVGLELRAQISESSANDTN